MASSSFIDECLKKVRDNNIKWVELQFTDILGYIRTVTISADKLDEDSFVRGVGKLDGSSIKGFSDIEESDLVLLPIPETINILPWSSTDDRAARIICRILTSGGKDRLKYDVRMVSEKLDVELREAGLKAFTSAEVEFFVFNNVKIKVSNSMQYLNISSDESPEDIDGYPYNYREGYYIMQPLDTLTKFRGKVSKILGEYFNIMVEAHHHEVAVNGQVEFNIKYDTPTITSDNILTLKYVSRNVASEMGYYVTFMPKPLYGDNGSGMHVHISLWRGSQNLFYDPDDEYAEISQYCRYFIGGLMEHGRSLSAIVSPTVNSYKRLVPGYEAPVYLAWSKGNRSATIRIPAYHKNDIYKRIEYRPPDPSANPYLALTAIIAAGLDGVNKKLDPGDPIDKNIYKLSEGERKKLGINSLPRDLMEALEELISDNKYLKPYFSKQLLNKYVDLKIEEFKRVNQYPTPIELKEYFSI